MRETCISSSPRTRARIANCASTPSVAQDGREQAHGSLRASGAAARSATQCGLAWRRKLAARNESNLAGVRTASAADSMRWLPTLMMTSPTMRPLVASDDEPWISVTTTPTSSTSVAGVVMGWAPHVSNQFREQTLRADAPRTFELHIERIFSVCTLN